MFTPLHAAAASGQITVVRQLIELGGEVDAVNNQGNTSLHVACLNGQDVVVSELISHGASINVANQKGLVRVFSEFTISMYPVWYILSR